MALEPFAQSRALTLGIELELQLVSRHDYDLIGSAADLLGLLSKRSLPGEIKPEMTSSMIEVATGICTDYAMVVGELTALRNALNDAADTLNIGICGGGTHPYQHWGEQQIFEAPRFHYLSDLYGYLAKQFTVFGQHVHIGCSGADEALTLLHGLSRYIPHFIALSASSPFVQGYDSGFDSARLNSVAAFPMSGRAPFVESWRDFAAYFDSVAATGVVKSMKDFYWDIRPKPEFGTIEVRVMDTPLSIETAAEVAAYIQSVARWLTIERPFRPREADYLVYTFNRFQACRFGYSAAYIDPETHVQHRLGDHIRATLGNIEHHAAELGADTACAAISKRLDSGWNDAGWLRKIHTRERALPELVRRQCLRWRGE